MDILSRYTTRDYWVTFVATVLVFTFVMCIGAVVKAIDLFARGVSGRIILKAFLLNMPYLLTFSIPMSALTTVLLNFSRMSLEGEVTAMKACGLSVWQIAAAPLLWSLGLLGLCLYLTSWAAPESHFARRNLLAQVGAEEPLNLLEEGRFVKDFPGFLVYVGRKERGGLRDIVMYELGPRGVERSVRAQRGRLRSDPAERMVYLDLYEVRIDQPDGQDPANLARTRHIVAEHYPVRVRFEDLWGQGALKKKRGDMTLAELVRAIQDVGAWFPQLTPSERASERMSLLVEANKRLALSLSCLAFTLLGMPLGMKSRRRESYVGVTISLLVVFFFYFFVVLGDVLASRPQYLPHLIVWYPVIGAQVAGFWMLHRSN